MCMGGGSKTVYTDEKPLGSDTKPDGRVTKRREDLVRNNELGNQSGSSASPKLYDAGGKNQGAVIGAGL